MKRISDQLDTTPFSIIYGCTLLQFQIYASADAKPSIFISYKQLNF
jgi:hypothetical protein